MDRFGRSLRFCHLGFNRKAIFMVAGVKMPVNDSSDRYFRDVKIMLSISGTIRYNLESVATLILTKESLRPF